MVRNLSKHRFNYSFSAWFTFLTLSLLFIFIPDVSAATQASFEWEPNTEPDLAGYRIFSREQNQPYDYADPAWEGTDAYCTIYDLDESKSYCFVVRAFDTEGFESENSDENCLESSVISNQSPVADAGPDQIVNEGQTVMLNGSNSTDPDDDIVSYHWTQIGEPALNLSDPDAEQPIFTAPEVGFGGTALTFELTVIDLNGNQAKDVCIVNVTWQNEPPTANAGADQTVDEGVMVTLDGSSSLDIDDGISTYVWTQIGVPTVTLSDPTTLMSTFIAPDVSPEGVSFTFHLTVTDAGGLQHTDACIVNITWQNEPPTAVVAPDYLERTGETLVTLDGSASTDPDDGIASYLWTQVEGDPVSFSNPTSAVTSFTAPATDALDKNIELRLTVTDHGGLKDTADSSIYVMQNEPPTLSSVSISGSSQINESSGAQYILTAYYSDDSSTEVTGFASWSDNSSYASINSNGYLTASSVVSDQPCTITASYEGQSDTHNVIIENIPPNNSPAIDFSYATRKKKVTFSDRSNDSDGTVVSWLWDFGDGTYNIMQNPEHRYTKFGNYSVTLTVTDNEGVSNSISKTVSITK
jgi:PKD repeat protein